jgi:SHS2 domain-containing protein
MYEVISLAHTADIRLKIEAATLDDLFRGGLVSMGNIMKENLCGEKGSFRISRNIDVSAPDTSVLLIDFLSEVLTISHAQKVIFCKLKIQYLDELNIRAFIYGRKIDSFDEAIKAVTYHEAEVFRNKNNRWQTNLIFDI